MGLLTRQIRTGIVFSFVLACIVITAIALYADVPRVLGALASFRWQYLPLILGLTLFNYFCRFFTWQYYLKRLDVNISSIKSLLHFLFGLPMPITPGKLAE